MAFGISSPAFPGGGIIPRKYTLDGDNLSPPFEWREAPEGTKSFAMVMEDPDAPNGTFHHWAIYNIPGRRDHLPEAMGQSGKTGGLGMGVNDFGHPYYDGPKPPKGHGPHHYHFRLVALDVDLLGQSPKASVEDVWNAAREHALAEAEIVGTYER